MWRLMPPATYSWFHTFPKGFSLKMNLIVRLEFKLAYFEAAVQYLSHYATKTPLEYSFYVK